MVINADDWEKLKPLLHDIDEAFDSRFDKLFPISDGFNVLISGYKNNIYVDIDLSEQRMKIKNEKWITSKENIPLVNEEFNKRYLKKTQCQLEFNRLFDKDCYLKIT